MSPVTLAVITRRLAALDERLADGYLIFDWKRWRALHRRQAVLQALMGTGVKP